MALGNANRTAERRGGDGIMFLLFVLAMGWGGYELFYPKAPVRRRGPPTLKPGQSAPDRLELLRRIRQTPPAAPAPAWRPKRLDNRWQWIVLHHSDTFTGNAKIFDRYHSRTKNMENGLAYHFVIGNGSGSGDGQVEVGRRWREQLDGGHVRGDDLNRIAIGICLVGDFEESMPTVRQIASLKALLNYLLEVTRVDEKHVKGHRQMPGQDTLCPGAFLPVAEIVAHRRSGVRDQGPGTGDL